MTESTTTNEPAGIDLAKLEALAKGVPEHIQLNGWYVNPPSFGHQHVYADDFKGRGRQHIASIPAAKKYFGTLADFIAAANPATVLQLIALARRATTAQHQAGGKWNRLDVDDMPDATRKLDVVLMNGVTEYSRDYSVVDWTQVHDWRYSAPRAATTASVGWIGDVIRDVAELPDRDSPADQPEMMLVTGDELREIIERHATAAATTASASGEITTCDKCGWRMDSADYCGEPLCPACPSPNPSAAQHVGAVDELLEAVDKELASKSLNIGNLQRLLRQARAALAQQAAPAANAGGLCQLVVGTQLESESVMIAVHLKRGDHTTVLYTKKHSLNGGTIGVQSLPDGLVGEQQAAPAPAAANAGELLQALQRLTEAADVHLHGGVSGLWPAIEAARALLNNGAGNLTQEQAMKLALDAVEDVRSDYFVKATEGKLNSIRRNRNMWKVDAAAECANRIKAAFAGRAAVGAAGQEGGAK
jgi:hypothetical protein